MLFTYLLWPQVIWGQPLAGEEEMPPDSLKQLALSRDEAGVPFFFEHFKPQDYGQYHQNWGVVQDQQGIIYVANKYGVLEYDGASWRLIETEIKSVVRSLTLGGDRRVYVGAKGDFGYLAPDSTSTLRYVSLMDKVAPEHREFSDVWGTHTTSEGVYFQTSTRLFRWDGKTIKAWQDQRGFHTSFVVRDRLYVRAKDVGLLQLSNDSLSLAPGGEAFAQALIYMMAPFGQDGILIGTRGTGFFMYRQGSLVPFPTEADPLLKAFDLYHGCTLPGGFYALATLGGGVLIIDDQGRLVQILNKASGFPDDWVNYVFADSQGGLWMALDAAGIARVDVPSQLTMYDDQLGLDGTVLVTRRHQGALYIGTSTGLFKLERSASEDHATTLSIVEVLPGASTPALLSVDSILFAATHEGLYAIRGGRLSGTGF